MLPRATSHWPTTKGAAGNGLSLSRSIASNSERRLPSRGGANGRLFHSSIFSASAALASASEKNCRWRSGASTHISTSRSEEHTSELQSLAYLVCRLLL